MFNEVPSERTGYPGKLCLNVHCNSWIVWLIQVDSRIIVVNYARVEFQK